MKYTFRCLACGAQDIIEESMKKISDRRVMCECGKQMGQVYYVPEVQYKGDGFYCTDNKKGSKV